MSDHHPAVWDALDELWRREMQAYRCTDVDGARRCQLVRVHDGWPHVHAWFERAGRRSVTVRRWVWETGQPGRKAHPGPLDPVPPWAACLRD